MNRKTYENKSIETLIIQPGDMIKIINCKVKRLVLPTLKSDYVFYLDNEHSDVYTIYLSNYYLCGLNIETPRLRYKIERYREDIFCKGSPYFVDKKNIRLLSKLFLFPQNALTGVDYNNHFEYFVSLTLITSNCHFKSKNILYKAIKKWKKLCILGKLRNINILCDDVDKLVVDYL